ncbi:MAG: FeoB-associated Cys-rich membrane protein [Lachnospiraceae bacterium]|nr:FeoB-associated Cys-rich membrane protein [Lachnospiraceae bacterium]
MNAASWIVLFILVMIVGFILYRMVKRTKNGMPPTCGGNCTSCGKLCAKRNQDSK